MTILENTPHITLTKTAAEAIQELLDDRGLIGYGLRVFISGGGCSGYQYGMSLEKDLIENDIVLEQHGVKLFIDDVSIHYLVGATVDFVNSEVGSGFQINNPNPLPASSCGCGNDEANPADNCGCGSNGHGDGTGCNC